MKLDWKHQEKYVVRAYQVGSNNRASVQSLCGYMEDAAGQHAEKLGVSIERLHSEGIGWVLARMQLEILALPQSSDEVLLTTWPVGVEKLQFRRDFLLSDKHGEPLVKAVSQWVIVNMETRRVERVPSFIRDLRPENAETIMPEASWRIAGQADSPETALFSVRLSDIDRNKHVNNVHFIDWVIESAPFAHQEGMRLQKLEIIFRAEAVYGDKIVARGSAGVEADEFLHGLFRQSDGQELIRARSVWGR